MSGETEWLRENIKGLLFRERYKQKDLAFFAQLDPASLSKFLKGQRELHFRHIYLIAEFFGIETYRLFQPGTSPTTERRTGRDRRQQSERRIGHEQRMTNRMIEEIERARPRRTATGALLEKKRA